MAKTAINRTSSRTRAQTTQAMNEAENQEMPVVKRRKLKPILDAAGIPLCNRCPIASRQAVSLIDPWEPSRGFYARCVRHRAEQTAAGKKAKERKLKPMDQGAFAVAASHIGQTHSSSSTTIPKAPHSLSHNHTQVRRAGTLSPGYETLEREQPVVEVSAYSCDSSPQRFQSGFSIYEYSQTTQIESHETMSGNMHGDFQSRLLSSDYDLPATSQTPSKSHTTLSHTSLQVSDAAASRTRSGQEASCLGSAPSPDRPELKPEGESELEKRNLQLLLNVANMEPNPSRVYHPILQPRSAAFGLDLLCAAISFLHPDWSGLETNKGDGEVTRMGAGESYRPSARPRSLQRIESFRPDRDRSPRRDRPRSPIATDSWHPNSRNRSPPRRRSRTPLRRDRTPPRDNWRARGRTPPRVRSPPRRFSPRRDDDRRPRSPLRRDERRRSRSPFDRNRAPPRARSPIPRRSPPAAPRNYRPRSRSPDRRDDRANGHNSTNWRRRSPSPPLRESERSSGRTSGNTSRRSSPPIHPDRLHLTQNTTRETQPRSPVVRERSPAVTAQLAYREKESTKSTPRERSPLRQIARSPVRSAPRSPLRQAPRSPVRQPARSPFRSAPRSPVRQAARSPLRSAPRSPFRPAARSPLRSAPRSPVRQAPRSPIRQSARSPARSAPRSPIRSIPKSPGRPAVTPRSPPRGPASFRAPPTGPSGNRNFTAPSPSTTMASQRLESSGSVVPPSGPRGYIPTGRGASFGMRGGRSSFGSDRVSRPDTSSWGSAPPNRAVPVVAPRGSPPVSRPTPSPSPSISSAPAITAPLVPTGPSASAGIPTGPRAGVATRPQLQHSSTVYGRAPLVVANAGPRPHPAMAVMPQIIPGGRIDPTATGMSPEVTQRLKRREEEADIMREELHAKQEKLRQSLRGWDKLSRDAAGMALRTELSERHVRMLAGEGVGGAAF